MNNRELLNSNASHEITPHLLSVYVLSDLILFAVTDEGSASASKRRREHPWRRGHEWHRVWHDVIDSPQPFWFGTNEVGEQPGPNTRATDAGGLITLLPSKWIQLRFVTEELIPWSRLIQGLAMVRGDAPGITRLSRSEIRHFWFSEPRLGTTT